MPDTTRPVLAVIIGSTRSGRFGPTVARWFTTRARRRGDFEIDLIDLAETRVPATLGDHDDLVPPQVAELGARLAAADAFAIVTPEYNQSFPASLKTAIDWYYREWHAKPVAFISYGRESGGLHAVAQLRQIFAELHAVTLQGTISLPCYWDLFAADGSWPKDGAACNTSVTTMLDQLAWWAAALSAARARTPYVA
ncbi:NAD(P)H-dependent oxidoreductase [Microbispora amethystogenes]|uniref:NADPH-dependent FMN reductase n=1 Tax=Microbispora amethystogenes TaxID=1427754 RepID=UPI00340589C9